MMARDNVTPLHRSAKSLPWAVDYQHNPGAGQRDPRPNLHDTFAEHIQRDGYSKPPLLDRMADALGSPAIIPIYLAFVAGFLCAGGLMLLWSRVLS